MSKSVCFYSKSEYTELLQLADFVGRLTYPKTWDVQRETAINIKNIVASMLGYEPRSFAKTVGESNKKNTLDARNLTSFLQLETRTINNFNDFCDCFFLDRDNFKDPDFLFYSDKASILNKQFQEKKKGDKTKASLAVSLVEIIEIFQDSNWYCYTRNENRLAPKIGRHRISFKKFSETGECNVVHEHYDEAVGTYEGHCRFVGDNYIAITCIKNKSYIHFLFKVEYNRIDRVDLCTGHVTYNHRRNKHVVSKTCIITKCNNSQTSFDLKLIDFDSIKEKKQIINFFRSRQLNRLSSPRKMAIFNLDTLEEWLDDHRPSSQETYIPLFGIYDLFYKEHPSDNELVKGDILSLIPCEEGGILAEFTHIYDNEEPDIWKGTGFTNFETKLFAIVLKGPLQKNANPDLINNIDNKPVFLLVSLPPRNTKNVDTLVGTIASYRDSERGSVAHLTILTKRTNDQPPKDFNEEQVKDFFSFYKERSWVRPPATTVVKKFSDLKKAIKNSTKLRLG